MDRREAISIRDIEIVASLLGAPLFGRWIFFILFFGEREEERGEVCGGCAIFFFYFTDDRESGSFF